MNYRKNSERKGEVGGMTYKDYLDARGYKPVCCDNSSEDNGIIFCCYMSIYSFLVAYFCLLMKAVLRTGESHAALYMFAFCFVLMAVMTVLAITTNNIEEVKETRGVKTPGTTKSVTYKQSGESTSNGGGNSRPAEDDSFGSRLATYSDDKKVSARTYENGDGQHHGKYYGQHLHAQRSHGSHNYGRHYEHGGQHRHDQHRHNRHNDVQHDHDGRSYANDGRHHGEQYRHSHQNDWD